MAVSTDDSSMREALQDYFFDGDEITAPSSSRMLVVVTVAEGFVAALRTAKSDFARLSIDDAAHIVNAAADAAVSAAAWSEVIGDRYDTSQVSSMLGISRQALAKRQRNGSLIGLPGKQTTWFPAWQFDQARHRVHGVVPEVIAAFREHLGPGRYEIIAAWATNPQPEDLNGSTPADWIGQGLDDDTAITAARRAAAHFAQ